MHKTSTIVIGVFLIAAAMVSTIAAVVKNNENTSQFTADVSSQKVEVKKSPVERNSRKITSAENFSPNAQQHQFPCIQILYRVKPPNALAVNKSYLVELYDVLQIRATGTLIDQPLDGFFLVEKEGTVTLGPAYGRVRLVGMTVEETTTAITMELKKILNKPEVTVQVAAHGTDYQRLPGYVSF